MKTLVANRNDQLVQLVTERAAGAGISPAVWTKFMARLEPLCRHNERMYQHSLRVGLYAHGLAKMEGAEDVKLPLFGGCGHDMGKCFVPNAILDGSHLAEDSPEFEIIRTHADIGFQLLKAEFPFTAMIAGLHHSYQNNSYGIELDESPIVLTKESKATIDEAAHVVAISDFFDALTTRKNDKGLIADASDPSELRAVLLQHFPASKTRIDWLIANKL